MFGRDEGVEALQPVVVVCSNTVYRRTVWLPSSKSTSLLRFGARVRSFLQLSSWLAIPQYFDHYLKPLVPLIPSYIKDTTHFLNTILRIPTLPPHNTILITIDVTFLCTSIPNNEGIKGAINALSTLPSHTPRPPLQHFRTPLNFLTYNYFLFNKQHHLQIQGTAMGTRMAPSYANIFMAALGKQMLLQSLHNLQPLTWLRIIDDIFMLWTHGPKPLLTSFNPSTHFIPQSKSATNNPTPPSTSWTPPSNSRNNEHCSPHYTKPTDKGLLFHSSHHRQALPYGRIITNNHELHKHLRRLHKILLARGYSHSTITTAFNKVTSHTQSQLLQPKTPPVTNGIQRRSSA